jgi:hypothetical protein
MVHLSKMVLFHRFLPGLGAKNQLQIGDLPGKREIPQNIPKSTFKMGILAREKWRQLKFFQAKIGQTYKLSVVLP